MIENLNINIKYNKEKLKDFLKTQNLDFDDQIDTALVIKDNDKIIACACKHDNVFKMLAVSCHYQNLNYLNSLISELITISYQQGIYHYFIFTKTAYLEMFESLGFRLIVSYENIGLFEKGNINFENYYDFIKIDKNLEIGSIVMNCNPFTLGHRCLIENALKQCDKLIVFVVEDNSSYYSFSDRFMLVTESLKDLENVIVVASGPYIISQATFPTYFLKDYNEYAKYYTNIDILLFKRIMNKLNIKKRFVGSEPIDNLTNYYNRQLQEQLKDQLNIIERISCEYGVISASKVRKLINNKEYNELKYFVNDIVYDYLTNKR